MRNEICIGFDAYNQLVTGGVSRTLNTSGEGIPIVLVYDARGNGGGGIAPTIAGDHQNRVTDYTAIVVEHEKQKDIH